MGGALGWNVVRLAETALRTNGGFAAQLRMPGMAASGDDAEQLGLATPAFQDVPVGPAVWRKVGIDTALLLGAAPIAALMGSNGFPSAEALFEAAAGVVVDGAFYTISGSEPILSGGQPCGYRLNVLAPAWI